MEWFRFHDKALDNDKVQALPGDLFKHWVNLMCLANQGKPRGTLPTRVSQIAFRLRISIGECEAILAELRQRKLLDYGDDDVPMAPHDWEEHQYDKPSDAPSRVGERVKRHREQEKSNALQGETPEGATAEIVTPGVTPLKRAVTPEKACNATDTESESDTDSETEKNALAAHAAPSALPNGTTTDKPFLDRYADLYHGAPNKTAVLAEAFTELFGKRYPPNFPRLGAMAKQLHAGEFLKVMIGCAATYRGIDDPHDYLAIAVKEKASKVNGTNGHGSRAVDKSAVKGSAKEMADQFRAKQAAEMGAG